MTQAPCVCTSRESHSDTACRRRCNLSSGRRSWASNISIMIPRKLITGLGPSLFSGANSTPGMCTPFPECLNAVGRLIILWGQLLQNHPDSGGQILPLVCRCTTLEHQPLHCTAKVPSEGQMAACHPHKPNFHSQPYPIHWVDRNQAVCCLDVSFCKKSPSPQSYCGQGHLVH